MYVKVLALVGLAAVALAADLTVGGEGGHLFYEQNVTASPAIWKQKTNFTVEANVTDEVISRVVVIDNRPEKDGEAKVVEGGVGEKNVTIELKGPAVFRGFDFTVQVFTAPESLDGQVPSRTGLHTQVPQVPYTKDLSVNSNPIQAPKTEDDVIIGAPTPAAPGTTKASNKDNQGKINHPALVGEEQTRQNRDTKDQTEQTPISEPEEEPVPLDATKDTKTKENTNTSVQGEMDESLKQALDSIFRENSSPIPEGSLETQAHTVEPLAKGEPKVDSKAEEENRKVRQAVKEPVVPAVVAKDVKKEEEHTTTPKVEVSSTTLKIDEQEKLVPGAISTEHTPTPSSPAGQTAAPTKLPENVKTTQDLEQNVQGQHFGHHHAVPLPYLQ